MSIAPWWCGTIIATKSRSILPVGLIVMSFTIFVIAAAFSARKGRSVLRDGGTLSAGTGELGPAVVAVAELRLGHVDSALMMRRHHRYEVMVDITSGLHGHVIHHFRHGGIVLFQERGFRAGLSREVLGRS